jgi:cell division protein FtsN
LPSASTGEAPDEQVAIAMPVAPPGSESVSTVAAAVSPANPPVGQASLAETGTHAAISDPPPAGPRWSVQLGAFKVATNAEALRDRLALLLASPDASGLPPELRSPRVELGAGLSRVLIGDASDRAVALQWSHLLEHYLARPTIVFAH